MNIRNRRALIFCQRLSTVRLICEFFNSDQLGMNIKFEFLIQKLAICIGNIIFHFDGFLNRRL